MRTGIALMCVLAGCATAGGPTPSQEARQWALANAREVGAPEDCVNLRRIRRTGALDDRTIDFHMADGRVLRNRLPHACPGLAFEDGFSYRTSLDRLCSLDMITVRHGSGPGATCGLGRFQPVEIARR